MKISKSKQELARIISENGGWREMAEFAWFQGKLKGRPCHEVWFGEEGSEPEYVPASGSFHSYWSMVVDKLPAAKFDNWHQTILSRAEYFHLYPEHTETEYKDGVKPTDPAKADGRIKRDGNGVISIEYNKDKQEVVAPSELDADGWIEWRGGECPVDGDVNVKFWSGTIKETPISAHKLYWGHDGDISDIIAYRLHEPEQVETVEYNYPGAVYTGPVQSAPQFCESVVRSIPDPGSIDGLCSKVTSENKHQHVDAKPTIEQLAANYRNKLDYANRKQDEANKANMESDAALVQLEDAIAEIGFAITPLAATEKEPELVITDWRDLQVGDKIELTGSENHYWKEHSGREMTVTKVYQDHGNYDDQVDLRGESGTWALGGNTTWRFIHRP